MASNNSYERIITTTAVYSIVSDDLLYIFQVVNYVIIGQIIAVFGVITNIINMIVFWKIGFRETINVSLFGLAVSDFASCFTVFLWNLAMTHWFNALELAFYPTEVLYLVAGLPRNMFTKITTIITALVTFERCLCVVIPLKVKSFVTLGKVRIFVLSSYILIIGSYVPIYYVNRLAGRLDANRGNKSILGLTFTDDREKVESVVFMLQNALFSFTLFIVIIICTAVLVINLMRKAQWRQSVTTVAASTDVSLKEKRAAKMVIFISSLCIACFTPNLMVVIAMMFDHNLSITGKNANLFLTLVSFTLFLESLNSSMNIIIYYKNSSIYKAMFDILFRLKNNAGKDSK